MSGMRRMLLGGIAVSSVLLAVLVARLDWVEFAKSLRQVSGQWLLAAAIAMGLSISVRAVRWLVIAGVPARRFADVWYADVVGYVGNAIYPGRAGELLRIAALHRISEVRPGEAVMSAFADRLADVIVLGVAALAIASLVAGLPPALFGVALGVALVPLAVFLAFLVLGGRLLPLVSSLARLLPGKYAERVPRWYVQSLDYVRELRRPGILAAALALTAVAMMCDYAIMWFAFLAMGWSLPLAAAVAASILVTLGTLLPAAPGYIGIYQVACVLALQPFGVAESAALAYSVIVQATVLSVLALLGLVTFAHYGWSLARLR
jgi:uncharacterized protein (TIRG00374 family)